MRNVPRGFPGNISCLSASRRSIENHQLHTHVVIHHHIYECRNMFKPEWGELDSYTAIKCCICSHLFPRAFHPYQGRIQEFAQEGRLLPSLSLPCPRLPPFPFPPFPSLLPSPTLPSLPFSYPFSPSPPLPSPSPWK